MPRAWIASYIALIWTARLAAGDVVISEIHYHPAEERPGEEFVELHNLTDAAIDLEGWCLDGVAFCFGPGASIPAHGFVVLARDAAAFEAAMGFPPNAEYPGALDNAGESLTLFDAVEAVVDHVTYGDVPPWPVTPDGLGPSLEVIDPAADNDTARNWRASTSQKGNTAGEVNSVNAQGLPPWISAVDFVRDPLPDEALAVTALIADADAAELEYVTNFGLPVVVPMMDDGDHGDGGAGDGRFGAAVPGQAANVLLRLRISATGATGAMSFPRADDTVNYFGTVVADPALQTQLPVFHWFMDPDDYQAALDHYNTDQTEPALLYFDGVLYDGVRVRVRGQFSRGWPKKCWKMHFPQGHDFVAPGLVDVAVDELDLQACYSDKSYVRERLAYESFRQAGVPASQAQHVRLNQNGEFFGLYLFREALDNEFLERNGLDTEGAWYKAFDDCRYRPLEDLPPQYEKKTRQTEDYSDLHALLDGVNNLTGDARRNFLIDNLDVPALLNYLAVQSIVHNNDHPGKNFYLYRDTAGTGRWSMHPHDLDLTFGRNFNGGGILNDVIWADNDDVGRQDVSPSHPLFGDRTHQKYDRIWNRLIDALYAEPQFRTMYFRRLRSLMDALLVSGSYEAQIDAWTPRIAPEADLDRTRWGQYGQEQSLDFAISEIKDSYLERRRVHLFSTHRTPEEIPAPQPPLPLIVINEIMYNPAGGNDLEYLELYNPALAEAVDLSGWTLHGVDLAFPPGVVLAPGGYLVAVRNDSAFRDHYGSGIFVAGEFAGFLDNGGEHIVLRDATGEIIDEVRYDDDLPWDTAPDGGGPSLELIDVAQSNDRPANWSASTTNDGTPGAVNSAIGATPQLPGLWVNEVLPVNTSAHPDESDEYEPWFEIYNTSAEAIDLGGMFLTTDYTAPQQWEIPAGTILCGGEWIVFWADGEPQEGPLHAGFRLDPAAGSVGLYTADGRIIDYLNYDPLPADVSFGKYPDGTSLRRVLAAPTPAAANLPVSTPVLLNEYNAVAPDELLKDGGADTFWGRTPGNGGDWFELVVVADHLDVRGWRLVISDDTGGNNQSITTLVLSDAGIWSDLRSGTIITVSEDLADDTSYSPENGDWWLNVQASDGAAGTYITGTDFPVSQRNWQLTIEDSGGLPVFGPAGEGVEPQSGIGNDEVCVLEEDPGPLLSRLSDYGDGAHSTFGSPNVLGDFEATQDFAALRAAVLPCGGSAGCNDDDDCTVDECIDGECVHTPVGGCYELSLGVAQPAYGYEQAFDVTLDLVGLPRAVNAVQFTLAFDPAFLALESVVPGGEIESPWSAGVVAYLDESDGQLACAIVMDVGTWEDATVATLRFRVRPQSGATQLVFTARCDPFFTALTRAQDGHVIIPGTVDSAVFEIVPKNALPGAGGASRVPVELRPANP